MYPEYVIVYQRKDVVLREKKFECFFLSNGEWLEGSILLDNRPSITLTNNFGEAVFVADISYSETAAKTELRKIHHHALVCLFRKRERKLGSSLSI